MTSLLEFENFNLNYENDLKLQDENFIEEIIEGDNITTIINITVINTICSKSVHFASTSNSIVPASINIIRTVQTTRKIKTKGLTFLLNQESLFMSAFQRSVTFRCISAS